MSSGNHKQLANAHNSTKPRHPSELFVGNLSYFCQDQHLFDLFNSYGHVESVRTISADNGTRPLMFGFVRLSSVAEAQEMRTLLDNHLFMGRRIKIELSDSQSNGFFADTSGRSAFGPEKGYQLHLSFVSNHFSPNIIVPTETLLRRELVQFGEIIDVVVKQYISVPGRQEGYGFITFAHENSAREAISRGQFLTEQSIALTCEGSRRSGLKSQSNSPPQSHQQLPPKLQLQTQTQTQSHQQSHRHQQHSQNHISTGAKLEKRSHPSADKSLLQQQQQQQYQQHQPPQMRAVDSNDSDEVSSAMSPFSDSASPTMFYRGF